MSTWLKIFNFENFSTSSSTKVGTHNRRTARQSRNSPSPSWNSRRRSVKSSPWNLVPGFYAIFDFSLWFLYSFDDLKVVCVYIAILILNLECTESKNAFATLVPAPAAIPYHMPGLSGYTYREIWMVWSQVKYMISTDNTNTETLINVSELLALLVTASQTIGLHVGAT